MHVLFIHGVGSKYGAYHSLLGLITTLKTIDPSLEISIALSRKGDSGNRFQELERSGCNVYDIPYEPYMQEKPEDKWKFPAKFILHGIRYLFCRIRFLKVLKKQIDFKSIDLIHSNSSRDDFGAVLSKKTGIPLIWHIREFGDLDYDCYGYRRSPGLYMKRSNGYFIAVSEAVRKHWIQKGIPADRITTIYNGITEIPANKDTDSADECQNSFCGSGILSLVMVGNVTAAKGQHLIIQAISLLPEPYKEKIVLDIAGDGRPLYQKSLRSLVKKLRLEHCIRFLGYQKNFANELNRYDCGIVCSRCEGFGRVTAEYMMAGLPVLASDTGANPELVRDGETGFLFSYPDIHALKDKLIFLIENKDALHEMGRAASQSARQRFTALQSAGSVYQLYQEVNDE